MDNVKWITNDQVMLSLMTNNLRCQVIELHQGRIDLLISTDGKYAVEAMWIDPNFRVHATLRDMQVPKDRISTVGKYREVIVTRIGITPTPERDHMTEFERTLKELVYFQEEKLPCEISEGSNELYFDGRSDYVLIEARQIGDENRFDVTLKDKEGNQIKGRVSRVVTPDNSHVLHWMKEERMKRPPTRKDLGIPEGTEANTKERGHDDKAVRSADADAVAFHLISPHALERLAARYQLGLEKYNAYNWTKGFSHGQVLNHTQRHINHYLAGDRREDHLAAAAWGLFTLMHYEDTNTGTPDLKRYVETYDGIKPKDGGA